MAEDKRFEKALEITKQETEIADELSDTDLEGVAGGAICEPWTMTH
jgi:hypothetical protein